MSIKPNRTHLRGFGSMSKDRLLELSRKGGQSVAPEKRSFSQDANLAIEAGRKGGQASGQSKRNKPNE